MQKAPQKKTDIILAGQGSILDTLHSHLHHIGLKSLRIPAASDVYFIGNNTLTYQSEKIAFKKTVIVLPRKDSLPGIKGIDVTKYQLLPLQDKPSSTQKQVMIYGYGPEAVATVLNLAKNHKILLAHHRPLMDGYDISVMDTINRHLHSLGIDSLPHTQLLATVTKASKTAILTKTAGTTKKLSVDLLCVEPDSQRFIDVGLSNQHVDTQNHSGSFTSDVLILGEDQKFSIDDVLTIARSLKKRHPKDLQLTQSSECVIDGLSLFSFGIVEQSIMDTHHSYKRSIAKSSRKHQSLQNFIKILANMHGEVIGISGILPRDYPHTQLLRFAVQHKYPLSTILKHIDSDDELAYELLEASREIS